MSSGKQWAIKRPAMWLRISTQIGLYKPVWVRYTDLWMLFTRPKSLKSLILIHEIAFLLLVLVTGTIGILSVYFWQQNSKESVRIYGLLSLTEQIRGELHGQIQEMIRARILEDQQAFSVYSDYSRRIDKQFNGLRQKSEVQQETLAIQALQLVYREIQHDMNKIFNNPYTSNHLARINMLDPLLAQQIIGRFEQRYLVLKSLLEEANQVLDQRLVYWSRFAPLIISIPLILAILLVLYTRFIVNKNLIQPMASITDGVLRISQDRLAHQVEGEGVEELSVLSRTLNNMMADLKQSREALLISEKQAALGALIPVVGHNIRNPLASIRATAQLIDQADPAAELAESRQMIIDTIDRLDRWVNALVSYLHPLKPDFKRVRASDLLLATLALLEHRLAEKALRPIKIGWEHDHVLEVDPDLMEQALYGLVNNAIDASPQGGQLTLKLALSGGYMEFYIIDTGPGLPFIPRPGRLEPGPSSKRFGTGLGIPIAFKICQNHGWNIQFSTLESGGTQVMIAAPLSNIKNRTRLS